MVTPIMRYMALSKEEGSSVVSAIYVFRWLNVRDTGRAPLDF
jgi:hypothetical protein